MRRSYASFAVLQWSATTTVTVLIPNASAAIVTPEKVRDYLLSPPHPIGCFKAAYFRELGYAQWNWQQLERALRALLSGDAELVDTTEYGRKYSVSGRIFGPRGRDAQIVTLWIILFDEDVPRFVTAFPKD